MTAENATDKEHESKAANELAEGMAHTVETFLNSPISRAFLKFSTARCKKCGRRMDASLRKYVDPNVKLCMKCNIAYRLTKGVLNGVTAKVGLKKEDIDTNLKDPMWRKGISSVLEGIAEYGVSRPFTAYSPFLVVWNVTKVCNLKCKHCYESAGVPPADELTTEEAVAAVDKMADAGVAYIALSGGEPLARQGFWDIVKRINEREIALSIATNATLLTKENARKLKEANCLFAQISLDGATPETHNSFRGANAFERTIEGIKNAVEAGIQVGIATTVTKFNYDEVPQIIDLAESLGANIFMHYNFIPTGRGKEIMDMDLSPDEREKLLDMLASQIGKRKISLLSTAPQYSRVCSEMTSAVSLTHFDNIGQMEGMKDSVKFLGEFVGGCGTGRLYCALDYNGDITPCVFIPIKLGNIRNDDFLDVWHNSPDLKKIRNRDAFVKCGTCAYKATCGGCRARAYSYYGDLTQCDVGCILNKEEWNKLKASSN